MPFVFVMCYNSSPFFCSWIKKDKINTINHTPCQVVMNSKIIKLKLIMLNLT
jgi:hypothetical protein